MWQEDSAHEGICTSETSVNFQQATRRYIPEGMFMLSSFQISCSRLQYTPWDREETNMLVFYSAQDLFKGFMYFENTLSYII